MVAVDKQGLSIMNVGYFLLFGRILRKQNEGYSCLNDMSDFVELENGLQILREYFLNYCAIRQCQTYSYSTLSSVVSIVNMFSRTFLSLEN